MSVVTFKEIHEGRDGETITGPDGRTHRTHTRAYRAVTDDNADSDVIVKAHSSCPQLGDIHPDDAAAFCQRVRATNQPFSKRVWVVTAGYSTEREITDDPLAEPADITWNTQQFQRPYYFDRDGDGICNSAGDPFDPPVEGDDSRWVATVTKNVAVVPVWVGTYKDAVNASSFTLDGLTVAAGCAKIMNLSISGKQNRNDIEYRVLSLAIALDDRGWAFNQLDYGFRELVGTSGTLRHILNSSDNEPVTSPALLDGTGHAITNPTASSAVVLPFDIYREKDFTALPLS